MKSSLRFAPVFALSMSVIGFAQDKTPPKPTDDDMKDCPMHAEHAKHARQDHYSGVDSRGDQAMGFSHTSTNHHFSATENGGVIEATVKDSADTASLAQIRAHMKHIATMFSEGNFDVPMFIHGEAPAGVPEMKKLGSQIAYRYEELETGARVNIITKNADALKSIHDFVSYQVKEHRTGDDMGEHNVSDHSHKH